MTLRRAWTHLTTTAASGRRRFPALALEAIGQAIAAGEASHRAEVRMIVEAALPVEDALRGMTARMRARELFATFGVWDTEENCGVLVYVNLADRKVEIVADRGIARLVDAGEWQAVCRAMTEGFARGDYGRGAVHALEQLNDLLAARLPASGERPNQLPDKPMVL